MTYSGRILGLKIPDKSRLLTRHHFRIFLPSYNKGHDPDLISARWLVDEEHGHVLFDRAKRAVLQRPRDCLWWTASMRVKRGGKATMRRWCIRRVRIAFTNALKLANFDPDGRPLHNQIDGAAARIGLKGSLKLDLTEKALTVPFTEIERETAQLVKELVRVSPRTRGNS